MKGGHALHHFPPAQVEGRENALGADADAPSPADHDAKEGTWVDFLLMSRATWTFAFRPSDFSKLPTLMSGGVYKVFSSKSSGTSGCVSPDGKVHKYLRPNSTEMKNFRAWKASHFSHGLKPGRFGEPGSPKRPLGKPAKSKIPESGKVE